MGRFSLNCGLWYEILSTVFCSSDTMQRVACLISCMHSASFLPFPCTGMFSCIQCHSFFMHTCWLSKRGCVAIVSKSRGCAWAFCLQPRAQHCYHCVARNNYRGVTQSVVSHETQTRTLRGSQGGRGGSEIHRIEGALSNVPGGGVGVGWTFVAHSCSMVRKKIRGKKVMENKSQVKKSQNEGRKCSLAD